jgi:hypothetical protein
VQVATGPVNPIQEFLDRQRKLGLPTPKTFGASTPAPGTTAPPKNFLDLIGQDVGAIGPDGTLSTAQLDTDQARINATRRILSDPNARKSMPDFMIAELERIAAGGKPKSRGIAGAFENVMENTVGKIPYYMTRPLATVTSALKEVTDIPTGGASMKDFINQALAPDTAPSKYLPKSGINWLDRTIGMAADIALDPMMYVTFGASAWAGREGGLKLAAWAAKPEHLALAPSLEAKIANGSIARLREWALSPLEREVLGVPQGLSWSFGSKNLIGKPGTLLGKASEKAALVGKPLAHLRAALSDTGLFTPLQKLTAKEAEKVAGLTMYGRRMVENPDTAEIFANLASYASATKANAAARLLDGRLAGNIGKLVSDVSEYEAKSGNKLHEVIEGLRPAANALEQELADRQRAAYSQLLEAMQKPSLEFNAKRGANAYVAGERMNYVPRFLTDEAKDMVLSGKWETGPWATSVRRALDMSPTEFSKGPGPMLGRVLETGKSWLGVPLRTNTGDGAATMREINDIAQNKLGFKWFKEDAGEYTADYLKHVVNQAKRVAYVDSMFDFGPRVIQTYAQKIIPNKKVAKQWVRIVQSYDKMINPILDELSTRTEGVLGPRLALAEAILSSKPGEKILSKSQLDGVRKVLSETFDNLKQADDLVLSADNETRAAYHAMTQPLRDRMTDIEQAIATGDEAKIVSELGLRDLYKRMFPEAEIPQDLKTLAEDVLDAGKYFYQSEAEQGALGALKGALTGAEQNIQSSTTAKIGRLQREIGDIAAQQEGDISSIVRGNVQAMLAGTARNFDEVAPNEFFSKISNASKIVKNGQRVGDTLTIYGKDEYAGMRTFLSKDGLSGYAVKPDGDLVSVFNVGQKGMGEEAVFDAVMHGGATKLDAFDQGGFLPNKYRQFGFKEVDRIGWDPQYAPPRWKPEYGSPDVVFMELDERIRKYVTESATTAGRIEANPNTIGIQGQARTYQGLPGWIPDGLRDRLLASARGESRFGELTVPKNITTSSGAKTIDEAISGITARAEGKIATRQRQIDEARSLLDAKNVVAMGKEEWDNTVGKVYADDINKVIQEVTLAPPPGPVGEATRQWVERTQRALESLSAPGLKMTEQERNVMSNVLTQMKGMEASLAKLENERDLARLMASSAASGEMFGRMADDIIEGWTKIESLGVQMPPEVRDRLFGKIGELKTTAGQNKALAIWRANNKFFRTQAMLSPGFIARNSYTATVNNFVAGVTLAETKEGLKMAASVMKHGIDGALERLPSAAMRDEYENALKVMYASGAGQTADDIIGPILSKRGKKIIQGKIVGKWSNLNQGVEIAARFSLALSSLRKGLPFEAAANAVSRYHFDYTNLSSLDKFMSNIVPFWIFASRNIPLQIVNQIARPKIYNMYTAAQRNFPALGQENMPEWLRRRGPLQMPFMGPGNVINPDLPQIDLQEQIGMFSNPQRLLSQLYPMLKLPLEVSGNTQYWSGNPFSEKAQPVRGILDWPAFALGSLFGDAGRMGGTGQYYTNAKAAYAAPNLLPILATLQRLIPEIGGKSAYQDRAASSRFSFFGLPYRKVSQDEQFNEQLRRQFAIRDYMSRLTRTGYLKPKE